MARENQNPAALSPAWPARLSRSADRVAADDGEEAATRLVVGSGGLHIGFVLLLGLAAYAGASPVGRALFAQSAAAPWALAAVGLCAALLVSPHAASLVGLACLAVGGGGAIAFLGEGALAGAGPSFAAAVVLAEAVAYGLHLARRPSLVAPVSLAAAALATGALAYVLEGGELAATPWGAGLGGALALAFVTHARYAEGCVAWRHGTSQLAAAALTRWVEAPRRVALALPGFFFPDDDLPGSSST